MESPENPQEPVRDKEWRDRIRRIARGWLFSDVPSERFPHVVIVPLENPDLHDDSLFGSKLSEAETYRTITIGMYRDRPVGVLKSKFGSPAVAMAVELLADMGVRSIVGVGYCGALDEGIQCGDLVLPLACVRDDGTSARYVTEAYPAVADLESLNLLRHLLSESGHRWHCGLVWSTDAVLLETSSSVRYWSSRNVIGVDMESGALFTVARLLGVQAAAILVASDNPAAGLETDQTNLLSGTAAAVELSLEFAARMSQPPSGV